MAHSIFISICVLAFQSSIIKAQDRYEDWLLPYTGPHGSTHRHRVIRETQPEPFGNLTFEEYPSDRSDPNTDIVDSKWFVLSYEENYWDKNYMTGHHIVVSNPSQTVSVLEPGGRGGCRKRHRSTVVDTAEPRKCLVAINAGFFNTTSGACLGNVVSDGEFVHSSHYVQNAHFGIEKDGSLFFGYIPDYAPIPENFDQLVAGVIWLVRDGQNYIEYSMQAESESSQETGSLQYFVEVSSARMAVGHDRQGRLVIVSIEGKTGERGISLYVFAQLLIDFGVVNAINLDGGGSATLVINGTLANYPSDRCNISNIMYGCDREVSTVLCVHDIPCEPATCNDHGECLHGQCLCSGYWSGTECDTLNCGSANCSEHGQCTEDGCLCDPGYEGEDCEKTCRLGYYGLMCKQQCQCEHEELCDPVDGRCYCIAGYHGYQCQSECDYGTYGEQCLGVCDCADSCTCHPVTGQCDIPDVYSTMWQAGHCTADKVIVSKDLRTVDPEQYFFLLALLVTMVTIAISSIILNVVLISIGTVHKSPPPCSSHRRKPTEPQVQFGNRRYVIDRQIRMAPDSPDETTDSDNHHSDADVESAMSDNDKNNSSFIAKLTCISKRSADNSDDMWNKWKKKFRKKRKRGSSGYRTRDGAINEKCNLSSPLNSHNQTVQLTLDNQISRSSTHNNTCIPLQSFSPTLESPSANLRLRDNEGEGLEEISLEGDIADYK